MTATQAVAVKVMGDLSFFEACRFLGHQDTLYADTLSLAAFAGQTTRTCLGDWRPSTIGDHLWSALGR
ncbi:pectinesterase family protein [Streptosporangium sp. NPDC002607]